MVSTRQSSNMGGGSGGSSVGEGHCEPGPSSRKHQSQAPACLPTSTLASSPTVGKLNLLDLPMEILEKICSYLDFNTVAHLRPVRERYQRQYEKKDFLIIIKKSQFQKILKI